jgi:hypothetical protein
MSPIIKYSGPETILHHAKYWSNLSPENLKIIQYFFRHVCPSVRKLQRQSIDTDKKIIYQQA